MAQEVTIKCGAFTKQLTLSEAQREVLKKTDPRAVVSGPPGTGKSMVLMLKGLEWLQAGHDVIVFGLHASSLPCCRLIYTQLSEAYKESQGALFPKDRTWGNVKFEHDVFRDGRQMEPMLQSLLKHGKNLYVIMDDFCPENDFCVELMLAFMTQLRVRDEGIHLWAANWSTQLPQGFPVYMLTEALRYRAAPIFHQVLPAVEALKYLEMIPETHTYSGVTPACEHVPDVIHTRHGVRSGAQQWPINSERCGKQVARILRHIGVGAPAKGSSSPNYQYRDVLIISRNAVNVVNWTQPDPAFVRGLEASGIPVKVLGKGGGKLEDCFDDFILGREDKVTLMNFEAARGLDRAVVVCLSGVCDQEQWKLSRQDEKNIVRSLESSMTLTHQTSPGVTASLTLTSKPKKAYQKEAIRARKRALKSEMQLVHRLSIYTKATHQLIVVHLPKGVEGPSGSEHYSSFSGSKCVIL